MSAHHTMKSGAFDPIPHHHIQGSRGFHGGFNDFGTCIWNDRNEMTGFSEKNASGMEIASGMYTYDSLQRRIGVDETSGGTTTQTWIVYNGNSNAPYAEFNGSGIADADEA